MIPPLLHAFAALSAGLATLVQVLMIDLVLAGDNAVAVGLAAARLDQRGRRLVIWLGLAAAVALRIGLALIATWLLGLIGLLLAGGLLLLWVCWRLARDLRRLRAHTAHATDGAPGFWSAFARILMADVSMSLDNVLGVAGAAHDRPLIMAFGLVLSIALTGLAAGWIARAIQRRPWIGAVGLAIMAYVAAGMIWQGARDLAIDLGQPGAYNAAMPMRALDIGPAETAARKARRALP